MGERTHPYVVHHKDGGGRHCIRKAVQEDVNDPENFSGDFWSSALVEWQGWPADNFAWDAMVGEWSDGVAPKIQEHLFADHLQKAKDRAGGVVAAFDPNVDG